MAIQWTDEMDKTIIAARTTAKREAASLARIGISAWQYVATCVTNTHGVKASSGACKGRWNDHLKPKHEENTVVRFRCDGTPMNDTLYNPLPPKIKNNSIPQTNIDGDEFPDLRPFLRMPCATVPMPEPQQRALDLKANIYEPALTKRVEALEGSIGDTFGMWKKAVEKDIYRLNSSVQKLEAIIAKLQAALGGGHV